MTTKKRQVFYSFHYKEDVWRTSQIRNIGVVEGDQTVLDNGWEKVREKSNPYIKNWIDNQMKYRSCTIVLVGEKTAGRKWINYEIEESWRQGMGVVGIYIHGLKDYFRKTASKGKNPFSDICAFDDQKSISTLISLSSIVRCYPPQGGDSKEKYDWIKDRLARITEEAIRIRNEHKHITIP